MEHRWARKGEVLYSVGFVVDPKTNHYIGYKLFPEHGNSNIRIKPCAEICKGILHKAYTENASFIVLRSKKIQKFEYKDNTEAGSALRKLLLAKTLDGWIAIKPAFPGTILGTPWKHLRTVKVC